MKLYMIRKIFSDGSSDSIEDKDGNAFIWTNKKIVEEYYKEKFVKKGLKHKYFVNEITFDELLDYHGYVLMDLMD